jgi:hypothetical protein
MSRRGMLINDLAYELASQGGSHGCGNILDFG